MPETILKILQILVIAEPRVVLAVHNLLAGTGTAEDLVVLKADVLAWQAVADHAARQIADAQKASG